MATPVPQRSSVFGLGEVSSSDSCHWTPDRVKTTAAPLFRKEGSPSSVLPQRPYLQEGRLTDRGNLPPEPLAAVSVACSVHVNEIRSKTRTAPLSEPMSSRLGALHRKTVPIQCQGGAQPIFRAGIRCEHLLHHGPGGTSSIVHVDRTAVGPGIIIRDRSHRDCRTRNGNGFAELVNRADFIGQEFLFLFPLGSIEDEDVRGSCTKKPLVPPAVHPQRFDCG